MSETLHVPDPLHVVLSTQDGVATRAQLLAVMSEQALQWKLASGRWQTLRPGVVVVHSGPPSEDQRVWADLLFCGTGAVLAGASAATLDGLEGWKVDRRQILVPHGRQVTSGADLEVHSSRRLGLDAVHPFRRPPRTRPARSLVDAASWARSDAEARTVLAMGIQQRLARPADLLRVLDGLGNLRRRRLILATVADAAGGSESLPELEFLALCRRHGLPTPTRQVVRRDSDGRRRWLDAHFEPFGLVVEVDGRFHMAVAHWWQDMWRDNEHAARHEALLRFPSFAIRDDPVRVAAQLAAALRARGWTG